MKNLRVERKMRMKGTERGLPLKVENEDVIPNHSLDLPKKQNRQVKAGPVR